MNEHVVEAEDVVKTFRSSKREFLALDSVSLRVRRGETMAVVGESGSGKTTLGRCLLGLTRWDSGTVRMAGIDAGAIDRSTRMDFRTQVQMVFQDPYGSLNPRMRVSQTLSEPLMLRGVPRAERAARVEESLARVGMSTSYLSRYPGELSGGEAQRVGIARAIIGRPAVVVLDEPTAALDAEIRRSVYELLQELQSDLGLTYVIITHDLASIASITHSVTVMHRGRVVEHGEADAVLRSPRHPYTLALRAASPQLGLENVGSRNAPVLSGEDSEDGLRECHLHGRCPLAVPRCTEERPPLALAGSGGAQHAACWRSDDVPELGRSTRRLEPAQALDASA